MSEALSDTKRTSGKRDALRGGLLAGAVAMTGIFFIDLCSAVFACGCRSLWDGAAVACNIHQPSGPHCPWCAHPDAGAVAFFAVVLTQAAVLLWPSRWSYGLRVMIAAAAFPAIGGLVGRLHGWLYGYGVGP